jgi:hypothetical protein
MAVSPEGRWPLAIKTLGTYPNLSIKEARLKAAELAAKRSSYSPTVQEAAEHWLAERVDSGPQMTNLHTLNRRLDKLDGGRLNDMRRSIVLRRLSDDSNDAAIARWCVSLPGEPPPSEDDNILTIVRTLVAPK